MERLEKLSDFRYRDLYVFSLALIAYGILLEKPANIINGLIAISISPSILITDYMAVGGVGASFINAGLMCLITSYTADKAGSRVTGALIAGIFTVTGFSFFGKNIINSIPVMTGVYLYTKYNDLRFNNYMHIVCFVTGMSPIVSLFFFGLGLNPLLGLSLGILTGLIVGFIIIPLSSTMLKFHDGYSLYNIGFTLGIIGIPIAGFLRMFDIEIPILKTIYEGEDLAVILFALALCVILITYGLVWNKGVKNYDKIYKSSGRLVSDYTVDNSKPIVLLNMGLVGLICMLFVKISGGIFNGAIMGGIFTVMGFAAFGKHPKNVIPIMVGVFIASNLNKYEPSSTEAILVGLFATTIAPIAGEFGILAGIIAGFIHKSVATNVGFLHGGVNLYNNGLAGGIVAAILVPLMRNISEDLNDKRKRQGKKNS